ncbi:hypothetical protein BGZ70_000737 [Mortierella alpina]|uniref:BZIP domain-containing protein n=1 Tax=Mortierella alpina TaxID=64518 RepID=A0A9P6LYT0_MORAP|nr:hypothetical protein BGZ70_000737 [Mortierella alpina]
MSLEASDIRRDTNPTPTRFLLECGEFTPGFGLGLDTPYNAYDTSYKFLGNGTSKVDAGLFDTAFKTSPSSTSTSHPWSDMVFDDAYMSLRQMSPGISPPPSNSSASSLSSPPPYTSSSSLESTRAFTHELNPVFHKSSAPKPYHSDLEPPSLAPDSPTPDSIVPTDAIRRDSVMTTISQDDIYSAYGLKNGLSQPQDQDMSDHHDSGMDVDSDESNDEDGSPGSSYSRESSITSGATGMARTLRTRASARAASKSSSTAKSSSQASRSRKTNNTKKSTPAPRKPKASVKSSSTPTSTTSKRPSSSRKHSSPAEDDDEESNETKRRKFLERNRVAASKCREKKRQQTLKTIADADAITARNQALHETLDELQEEVRTLKNQILCHRSCSCDVIQKFVQSSFGTGSFMPVTQAPRSMSISSDSIAHHC